MTKKGTSALVAFSGGQDSTTILGWAKNNFDYVEAISFYYGQQHSIELEQGAKICEKLNIKRTLIDISFLKDICDSALTTSDGNVNIPHGRLKDLPASFVPNRNLILLSLANTYAQKVGIQNIITGTCETDSSGYPDCRRLFIDSLEATLFSASSKSLISVDYIRHILSILNTTYGPINKQVGSTPRITIEEEPTVLEEINKFFGGIATYNPVKEELLFEGYDACSFVYNLIAGTDHIFSLLEREDYKDFVNLYHKGLKSLNPYSVSPADNNFFLRIHTPLMYLNKAETFAMAEEEGVLELVIEESHTCYVGDRTKKHSWGYGCSTQQDDGTYKECPACTLRRLGYEEYLETKNI